MDQKLFRIGFPPFSVVFRRTVRDSQLGSRMRTFYTHARTHSISCHVLNSLHAFICTMNKECDVSAFYSYMNYVVPFYLPLCVLNFLHLFTTRSGMLPMSTPSANPAQLTIFYGGSVCVYDSVPPEKVIYLHLFTYILFFIGLTVKLLMLIH